jgi:hypothetical protein
MKKWNKFCCLFLALSVSVPAVQAQIPTHTASQWSPATPGLPSAQDIFFAGLWSPSTGGYLFEKNLQRNDNFSALNHANVSPASAETRLALLPGNYSLGHMAFFCKEEWNVEKATGIPLRFRVGSLQDCDWLEQKPNAQHP